MTIGGIIIGGTVTTYNYDKNNRLLSETKTVSGTNTVTNYGYDNNGNQTSKGSQTYQYNGFNQLKKVTDGSLLVEYKYNADGLRISKKVNTTETRLIWDGQNIATELFGGNVTAKYIRGINLISSNLSGTVNYYLFNGHGDVVQLTNSSGNVVKIYDYDAFGNEKAPDVNDNNVFRYCGEYFDKETGTYYLRARYYNPGIGRFISEDSYWGQENDPLSLNLYAYCANNPIIFIDPTGHHWYFLGVDDALQNANAGLKDRASTMLSEPSIYNIGNWMTMGYFDTVKGAIDPEKPLSLEHWLNSASVVLTFYGGYSQLKAPSLYGQNLIKNGPSDAFIKSFKNEGADLVDESSKILLPEPSYHKHHLFPQSMKDWFSKRGINVDDFTVRIAEGTHLKGIHGKGGFGPGDTVLPGKWNDAWKVFIKDNPNATAKEVYQYVGKLIDDFGLNKFDIVKY